MFLGSFNELIKTLMGGAGEAIPSIVVLWVMREMPPRARENTLKGDSNNYQEESTEDGYLTQPLIPNPSLSPHWTVPVDGQSYLVIPARSSSDISIQQSEVLIFLIFIFKF